MAREFQFVILKTSHENVFAFCSPLKIILKKLDTETSFFYNNHVERGTPWGLLKSPCFTWLSIPQLNMEINTMKNSSAKSSTKSSSAAAKKSTKKVIGKVESVSKPGTFHTQYRDAKGKVTCSCIGFQTKKKCHHVAKYDKKVAASLKSSSSARSGKLEAPKGKTTRVAMITLLLKNKGKVVSINSLRDAVKKMRGYSDERAASRVKAQVKKVAEWAKTHKLTFNSSKTGLKLVA